ncbi:lig_chan-Glu_bd domain-containing protein [Caerostris extrusa]|uniref:Lig_chan-Glu_bd domain-containing protein n=1 Tax=Caerostris extrusa TaxID=172846 RepID=A0AAV4TGW4_CAEEX|nr:lig_chan-Glu_bd domain-containing protein [Caerostris extrusa]
MELLMHVNRKENGDIQLEGCEGKFLQIVLEALRIQYEIAVSKDVLYYDILPDGNFTGNVGKVQSGEADLTIGYLSWQEIRSKAVDFSMPYMLEELGFVTPKPGNIKSNLALLQVFDTTMWIGICFVLTIMSILFEKFKGSVGNNLLRLLGTVVGQSSNIGNCSLSSKMLLTAWLLYTLSNQTWDKNSIVVVTASDLLIHVNRKENGEVQLEGCEGKFFQIVLEALRIEYEIVVSKGNSFGKALPDGNFTDMIGMVQRVKLT